jgi:hypothetical protein
MLSKEFDARKWHWVMQKQQYNSWTLIAFKCFELVENILIYAINNYFNNWNVYKHILLIFIKLYFSHVQNIIPKFLTTKHSCTKQKVKSSKFKNCKNIQNFKLRMKINSKTMFNVFSKFNSKLKVNNQTNKLVGTNHH